MSKRIISIFAAHDEDYLKEALEFIKAELTARKVSKSNIVKTELLAEETIVLLAKHAIKDGDLHINISKVMGDVSVSLSMKGEPFEPNPGNMGISEDVDDDEMEDVIRAVFMRAYGERYKYSHKKTINRVRILVDKPGQTTLYLNLLAMFLGLVVGFLLKNLAPEPVTGGICQYVFNPIKNMFMNALSIIIAPVIFFSLVTCFSQFKNMAELGRLAAKIMTVYMITTVIATTLGFSMALLLKPGKWGFALSSAPADTGLEINAANYSLLDTIIHIVPNNFLEPFLKADTLQIMFLAVLVGVAVGMIGEYSAMLKELFEACNSLFLTITTIIARFIPLVAFCSVALLIIELGGDSFTTVIKGAAVQIFTIFLMICVYGIMVLVVGRVNPIKFFQNIKEGMITAVTLCSSSASMPTNLKVAVEELGISPKLCNFSIPLGATVNMDGTCIYLSSFAMFVARAYGVEITSSMMLSMALVIMLLSLGAPGVPGNALICLGVVLIQIGVPVEGIGLIMAINPIVDMFDTTNNITGDLAATLVVARSENMIDLNKFYE